MVKKVKGKTEVTKDRYWNGVFTGVFLGCFILSISILVTIRIQGLKVVINPETLAKMVQKRVQAQASEEFPQLLEGFKKELPAEIGKNFNALDDLKIGFGQSEVKLPDEVLNAIKAEFNRIVESTVINSLNNYSTVKYEERMAQDAYNLVNQILRRDIIGRTYLIKSSDWFTVPVKIVGSSDRRTRMKI